MDSLVEGSRRTGVLVCSANWVNARSEWLEETFTEAMVSAIGQLVLEYEGLSNDWQSFETMNR